MKLVTFTNRMAIVRTAIASVRGHHYTTEISIAGKYRCTLVKQTHCYVAAAAASLSSQPLQLPTSFHSGEQSTDRGKIDSKIL